MIDINCTLLVQMVHFGVAYLLLCVFLFKPAIRTVQHNEDTQHQLMRTIEQHQAALLEQNREKEQQWQQFQQHIKKMVPVTGTEQESYHITVPAITMPTITKADVTQIKHDVAAQLVAKVNNVW